VVFGASLNHFTSRGGTLFSPDATIVQCDVSDTAAGRFTPVSHTIVGDATVVARALVDRLPERVGYRSPAVTAELAETVEVPDDGGEDGIDPRVLSAAVDQALPENRTLVIDAGHFVGFPSAGIAVPQPNRFVSTMGFGSIGLGLAGAIGAAIADPSATTVAAVGDGGLMMSLGELDTAVRYGLRLVVLVYNDEAYGAELHFLRMLDLDESAALFRVPPLEAVAETLGARAATVRTNADLAALPDLLGDVAGPVLIDCHVTQNVRAGWLEEAFQRAAH
jgi:acetolactate synthase I/II/III large subunit